MDFYNKYGDNNWLEVEIYRREVVVTSGEEEFILLVPYLGEIGDLKFVTSSPLPDFPQ